MEGDYARLGYGCRKCISIHSLRMEGDQLRYTHGIRATAFQSTPSAWRETWFRLPCFFIPFYFNPLPPHGGRHAPLSAPLEIGRYFNPLPPHGGRLKRCDEKLRCKDFNPLPPHGGRRVRFSRLGEREYISIHSLRMEGDSIILGHITTSQKFQSTPSAWRETPIIFLVVRAYLISIHSLRMEGDHNLLWKLIRVVYFNPLPPHGGRLVHQQDIRQLPGISIHSLRMEGDSLQIPFDSCALHFNPLPPHGGRRSSGTDVASENDFNPLPPHGGRLGMLLKKQQT